MSSLSETVRMLFRLTVDRGQQIAHMVKSAAQIYLRGLFALALLAIVSPVPFFAMGVYFDLRWLIASAGVWWAACTVVLGVAAAPVGTLLSMIFAEPQPVPNVWSWIKEKFGGNRLRQSTHAYVRLVSGVLAAEMYMSLIASVLPLRENVQILPIVILAVLLLFVVHSSVVSQQAMSAVGCIVLALFIVSMFFPATSSAVQRWVKDLDQRIGYASFKPNLVDPETKKPPAESVGAQEKVQVPTQEPGCSEPRPLRPSLAEIRRGDFQFFKGDGTPRAWFLIAADGRYELFDCPGHHPVLGERLEPVTSTVVKQLIVRLEAEEKTLASSTPQPSEAIPTTEASGPISRIVTIPPGTRILLRLGEPVDSSRHSVNQVFRGVLEAAIRSEGLELIAAGTETLMTLRELREPNGKSRFALQLVVINAGEHSHRLDTEPIVAQKKQLKLSAGSRLEFSMRAPLILERGQLRTSTFAR